MPISVEQDCNIVNESSLSCLSFNLARGATWILKEASAARQVLDSFTDAEKGTDAARLPRQWSSSNTSLSYNCTLSGTRFLTYLDSPYIEIQTAQTN